MIVTFTANPSLDRTVYVDRLVRGGIVRAHGNAVHPSGKGVNVSRILAANGAKTLAILPQGGPEGSQLVELLTGEGIEFVAVPIHDPVRVNLTVVERDGTVTKLNEPGPVLTDPELGSLLDAVAGASRSASWLVASGSLPAGAPDDLYVRLIAAAKAIGTAVALDTSGRALGASLVAGPDLVKPNLEELAEAAGRPLATLGEAAEAAASLANRGAGTVLASLGPHGALLVESGSVVHGEGPPLVPRSPVGAGDALLAGFLAAGGTGRRALIEGLTWAAATCRQPDSHMPGPADMDGHQIRLHGHIEESRPITTHPTRSSWPDRASSGPSRRTTT
ncbi:MAG: 1-phosphofructokinase family hexose kinase [Acidimicrobiales bacterium]